MKWLLILAGCMPLLVNAQESGVHFEQGLSWSQLLEKAATENKYIFVDCYATWCGPCKIMDRDIYSDEKVGDSVNARFISVKVQLDTSKMDNEEVKGWYGDAHHLAQTYRVKAFPTFLFFSPQGEIVHRDLGRKSKPDFISLIETAVDTGRQFYTLMRAYHEGKLSYAGMANLAKTARDIRQQKFGDSVAKDYIDHYLMKLDKQELYKKGNIDFISSFPAVLGSGEPSFDLFYRHGHEVDALMGTKNYARGFVEYVIAKEEADPSIIKGTQGGDAPEWDQITHTITKKYSKVYAERVVLDAKLRWYGYKQDWHELAKYNIEKIDRYGLDTTRRGARDANDMIWDVIFEHSDSLPALKKAVQWAGILAKIDRSDFTTMDTYANLLYKTGRVKEAMSWEEKAVNAADSTYAIRNRAAPPEYQKTLDKMKQGQPTWGLAK